MLNHWSSPKGIADGKLRTVNETLSVPALARTIYSLAASRFENSNSPEKTRGSVFATRAAPRTEESGAITAGFVERTFCGSAEETICHDSAGALVCAVMLNHTRTFPGSVK